MLPRELPIIQDALDVAEATMFSMKGKPRSVIVEATVRGYLHAAGFQVEIMGDANGAGSITQGPEGRSIFRHRPETKKQRLVSKWQQLPVPSSTEGGDE